MKAQLGNHDCGNSTALRMELLQFCTNPLIHCISMTENILHVLWKCTPKIQNTFLWHVPSSISYWISGYLTDLPLVSHICSESGQHWFIQWLVTYLTPSHYLNQCLVIVNWTLSNKFQWNFNQNSNILIIENTSENVVCEMASILSRGRWVKCFEIESAWGTSSPHSVSHGQSHSTNTLQWPGVLFVS